MTSLLTSQHQRAWGRVFGLPAAFLFTCALSGFASGASLNVYLSAPSEQTTYIAGAATETFNTLGLGNQGTPFVSSTGTYEFTPSSRFAVLSADQYGGANGSQYVSLGAQSASSAPVTLQLNAPATYFGFWWSAGDADNGLSFYYNDTLLARLTTANIINLLNSNNGYVTAVDGSIYQRATYYGNPNNHLDTSEPFSYVNVFASGTVFNKIVFDNSGTAASGFETDNHSVFSGAAEPNGASVFVESAPAVAVTASPEPAACLLMGLGLVGFATGLGLRRR